MKKPADYTPGQRDFIDRVFKPLAKAEAIAQGVTLTESQAVALAYVLAEAPEDIDVALTAFFTNLPAPEYNSEFEHPVHTWGRWAAAVDNDETLPGDTYADWVNQHTHTGEVTIAGVLYSGDASTLGALESFYVPNSGQMRRGYTSEYFMRFVAGRVAEGRLRALPSDAIKNICAATA